MARPVLPQVRHFNPRSPCGSDNHLTAPISRHYISIHAPRVGATPGASSDCFPDAAFQSTLPVWERPMSPAMICAMKLFQSTLPVWERRDAGPHRQQDRDFNPRSPCGSDSKNAQNNRVFLQRFSSFLGVVWAFHLHVRSEITFLTFSPAQTGANLTGKTCVLGVRS